MDTLPLLGTRSRVLQFDTSPVGCGSAFQYWILTWRGSADDTALATGLAHAISEETSSWGRKCLGRRLSPGSPTRQAPEHIDAFRAARRPDGSRAPHDGRVPCSHEGRDSCSARGSGCVLRTTVGLRFRGASRSRRVTACVRTTNLRQPAASGPTARSTRQEPDALRKPDDR